MPINVLLMASDYNSMRFWTGNFSMINDRDNRLVSARSSGFTLLEMAIVLVIVALVAAMGISASRTVTDSAKVASTNNRMKAIEAALVTYRLSNNRLPCPADGA